MMNRKTKLFLNKIWKNRNSKQRSFIVVVLIPLLVASFYYSFICADRYIAEARFAVKGNEMQQIDMLSGLAGIPAQGGAATDSFILQDYLGSREIIEAVGKEIDLEAIFNHPNADWLSRLGNNPTSEQKVVYWQKMVTSSYDSATTITLLKVRTFTPQDSEKLAKVIIRQSEKLINELSERARHDDLEFAQNEVERAEDRVTQARMAMNEFRNTYKDLDPTQTAVAKMTIIGELESQLAASQAELNAIKEYMKSSAPAVQNLQRKINALKQQIKIEKEGIAGTGKKGTESEVLSGVFASYEPLVVERTFAEKAYASTLVSLEAARVESLRKHRYLASFVGPKAPDDALEPQRIKSIATIFFACLILWGIGLLGLGAVRDHVGWV